MTRIVLFLASCAMAGAVGGLLLAVVIVNTTNLMTAPYARIATTGKAR